jgi:hypothetical protein
MLVVAKDLQTQYEKALDSASISRELRPQFRKWLRFYLDFLLQVRTFARLEVQFAAFHGQARLEESAGSQAQRSLGGGDPKYDFRLINHTSGVPVARASSSSN